MNYATLTQLRAYLGLQADETADDLRLEGFLRRASSYIDQIGFRRYDARQETRRQDYPVKPRSAFGLFGRAGWLVVELNAVNVLTLGRLELDDDLLECTQVVNGDGVVIGADCFFLEDPSAYPKVGITLTRASGSTWSAGSAGDWRQIIPVTGVWGYHEDYDRAWADSLDTCGSAGLSASATTFVVADADGLPEDREAPRFQAGQLLRLDAEYLAVRAVDYTADTLTVKRGANGSAAVAHLADTALEIYRPMQTIEQAALRLATWAYRQKDVNTFERISIIGTSQTVMPGAVPGDVLELLPTPRPMRLA